MTDIGVARGAARVACAMAALCGHVGLAQSRSPSPAAAGAGPAPHCADTSALVDRATAYVDGLGRDLGTVIATEKYWQEVLGAVDMARQPTPPPITIMGRVQPAAPLTVRSRVARTLRSSFLFVRMPDGATWLGFRDVIQVDGRPADSRRGPTLLEVPGESPFDRWRRLSQESARHNLGAITRTLNVPTFALMVLHAGNRPRFEFTSVAAGRDAGAPSCQLTFQETGSPTIIRNGVGGDVPASGSFRVDAATGRVLRSELIAGSSSTGVASKSVVNYARDPKLRLVLPREMREEYVAQSGERLRCVARNPAISPPRSP